MCADTLHAIFKCCGPIGLDLEEEASFPLTCLRPLGLDLEEEARRLSPLPVLDPSV